MLRIRSRARGPRPVSRRSLPAVGLAAAVLLAAADVGAWPDVLSTTPTAQSIGVARSTNILVEFAGPLDPATVIPANVLVTSSLQGTHAVSVSWNASDRELTIDPVRPFLPGERVKVTLGKGLRDLSGQPLPNGWHFEFSTWTAATPGAGFARSAWTWPIGSIAFNLTVGDLTADGFPEAIFSNVVPDSLTILASDGAGGFSPLASIGRPDATLPRHVAFGDVDADGRPDLVVCASGPNRVEVIRNLGSGVFAAPVSYATGQTPYGAWLGDLDADGDLDVVTANFNGHSLSVLKNLGGGTLSAFVDYPAGAGADSPRWVDGADLDGDGDIDLVCCNGYSYDVSVFVNDGTGALSVLPVRYPVGESPQFCELRDLTGDRVPDLVTVNSIGESISVLRGNGDATFQPAVHTPVQGQFPYGLQVVDVDGDRDLDVLLPIRGASAWQIVRNDGAGNFTAGELYAGGNHCHTVGAADWDGDGDIDVAAGYAISKNMYFYEQASAPAIVATTPARNAGGHPVAAGIDLFFNVNLQVASLTGAAFAVAGAVSGPHAVDVTWSPVERKVRLAPSVPFAPGEIVTAVVKRNAVVSAAGLPYPGVALQFMTAGPPALGTFAPAAVVPLPSTDPVDVATADFDGDGRGDLAVAGYLSGDVTLALTGGSGWPEVAGTVPVGSGPVSLRAADLDGDGRSDLAVACAGSASVTLLRNDAGVLTPSTPVPLGGPPFALEAGDLDLDGDVDLVAAVLAPAALRVLRNDGGVFSLADSLPTGTPPVDVAIADVDRDGALDLIAVLPVADEVRLWRRDPGAPGSGFVAAGAYSVPDVPVGAFAWDADGDGWIDLAVASYGAGTVSLLTNTGGAGFAAAADLVEAALPRGPWGTDLDANGALDLAVASSADGSATVLLNDGAGAFVPNEWPALGQTPYALTGGDFDADGRVDLAVVDRTGGTLLLLRGSPATGAASAAVASRVGLLGVRPNPFRDRLTVRLALGAVGGPVDLGIYDVGGRVVSRIHAGPLGPGPHELTWDGRDAAGRRAASGVYFVRLEASGTAWNRKVLRLR